MKCDEINKTVVCEALRDKGKMAEIERHIQSCPSCRNKYGLDESLTDVLTDVLRDTCLGLEEIEEYVSGKINDEEKFIYDMHLNDCAFCKAAVEDFKNIASGCFDDIPIGNIPEQQEDVCGGEFDYAETRRLAAKPKGENITQKVFGVGVSEGKYNGDLLECIATVVGSKGKLKIIGSQVEEAEIGGRRTRVTPPLKKVADKIEALFKTVGFFVENDCINKDIIVELRYKGAIVEAASLELAVATAIYGAVTSSVLSIEDLVFSGSLEIDGSLRQIDSLALKAEIAWESRKNILILPKENENDKDLKKLESKREGNLEILFFDTLQEVFRFLEEDYSEGPKPSLSEPEQPEVSPPAPDMPTEDETKETKKSPLWILLAIIFVLSVIAFFSIKNFLDIESTPYQKIESSENKKVIDEVVPEESWDVKEEKLFRETLAMVPVDSQLQYPHMQCFQENASRYELPIPLLIGLAHSLSYYKEIKDFPIGENTGFMRNRSVDGSRKSSCFNIGKTSKFVAENLGKDNGAIVPAICAFIHQASDFSPDPGDTNSRAFIAYVREKTEAAVNSEFSLKEFHKYDSQTIAEKLAVNVEEKIGLPFFVVQRGMQYAVVAPFHGEAEERQLIEKFKAATGWSKINNL